ncbi:MAG: hypothetical protein J5854_06305 [Clostridia bacterium]|nr:hypothetical protein [Clostridia bacterium]
MKRALCIITVLLFLALMIPMMGCGKDKIVGIWGFAGDEINNFEFLENGTVIALGQRGTWEKTTDGRYAVSVPSFMTMLYGEISGNTLTLKAPGGIGSEIVLTRK